MEKYLEDLYNEIAHGDEEHRKWLKNKMEDYSNKTIVGYSDYDGLINTLCNKADYEGKHTVYMSYSERCRFLEDLNKFSHIFTSKDVTQFKNNHLEDINFKGPMGIDIVIKSNN